MIYFAVAGKFDCNFFSFAVFAVNLISGMTDKLIQKSDCSLGFFLTVRYVIVVLGIVVQVFN